MDALWTHLDKWIHKETALITEPTPLLILASLLIVGSIFSRLAKKLKIPVVTGQILGGVFIGHYMLNLFHNSAFQTFEPITNFALGFIGLTIGSHLDFRKLHNAGRRIIIITLTDIIITPTIVFLALYYLTGLNHSLCLIISAIAITTAPGSTIHIIKEKRAQGILTKTILAVVALNNVLTILIFYSVYYFLFSHGNSLGVNILHTIGNPFLLLLESIATGSIVGFAVIYITEKHKTHISFLTIVILAVVITVGTSETLHFSGILSSLILGIIITNFSKNKNRLFGSFKEIEKEVFLLFFVLAGTHLDFKAMITAGGAGIVLILSRTVGKTVAPTLGAVISGTTKTVRNAIGLSLYPIAGLAIGLVLLCENIPFLSQYSTTITAVMLTAVVVNELIGPIFTGLAIKKAGEEDKNRVRLMDFIQEEFIKTELDSKDKWDALDELAEFLYKTHKCHELSLEALKKSVKAREKEISTGIGENLAIPHAIIEGGPKIRGVIGISKEGIDFESMDGKPVHIIFLIATPKQNYDLHLKVLANISKIFGHHPHIKDQLIKAKNSEEVYEILQAEEVEELNPFFEK